MRMDLTAEMEMNERTMLATTATTNSEKYASATTQSLATVNMNQRIAVVEAYMVYFTASYFLFSWSRSSTLPATTSIIDHGSGRRMLRRVYAAIFTGSTEAPGSGASIPAPRARTRLPGPGLRPGRP